MKIKQSISIMAMVFTCMLFQTGFGAGVSDSLVHKGNRAYSNGNFEEAIGLYAEVTDAGLESAELYFNLGNAFYKLNDVAGAILNYEKAKKLDPNDEDIEFNLKLSGMRTIDKIESIPTFFITDWTTDLVNIYSEDSWGMISLISVWLGGLFLALYIISQRAGLKKLFFGTGMILLIGSFACFGLGKKKYDMVNHEQEAIVFTPSITIKSSPGENGNDLFVLHEGAKVRILDEVGEWKKIKLANGNVGWLPASTIQNI
jgi:tetratricopeptide (TPR) repeat protein